jgi:CBS domain-containing protein
MRIKDCMTREVRIVDPAETVRDAARTMIEIDAGFLPVAQDDRLIGIVTDRDLAVRALPPAGTPAPRSAT